VPLPRKIPAAGLHPFGQRQDIHAGSSFSCAMALTSGCATGSQARSPAAAKSSATILP
jgi:hypothetical protein